MHTMPAHLTDALAHQGSGEEHLGLYLLERFLKDQQGLKLSFLGRVAL